MNSHIFNFHQKHISIIIWSLRLIIGATFIISGLSKAIDLWGFFYKIEQYLQIWHIQVPSNLVVLCAAIIAFSEFTLGTFLATGSYKRTSAWLLLATMAIMLPLSAYIAIGNPVDDCGCFGELWKISNSATFIKNILLSIGLIYLSKQNKYIPGIFHPSLQWLQASITITYISIIGLIGYTVQPLIDFRNYKEGASIITDNYDETSFSYVYEKNGTTEIFDENNLPDSSWFFVDRIPLNNNLTENQSLTIYDNNGNDVTDSILCMTGEQLILLIPDIENVDISDSYIINELYNHTGKNGIPMIGIVDYDAENIWKDISMAEYPIYNAEDTAIKELARGDIAIVYISDGIIQWKRTASSIDIEKLSSNGRGLLSELYTHGKQRFYGITAIFIILLSSLPIIFESVTIVRRIFSKNEKKDVTLQ